MKQTPPDDPDHATRPEAGAQATANAARAQPLGRDAYGSDRWLMNQALVVARWGLGQCAPNPSVGAAIYDPATGRLVGRGTTQAGGRPHAEPMALAQAGDAARGATMAVTLEPCSHHGRSPPCVDAIKSAGVARVIYGALDPDPRVAGRGVDIMRAAGIAVDMADADQAARARWITRGHMVRITQRRPFVQVKLAVGRDGRIAEGRGGEPVWVTSQQARQRGHLLRAMTDAILVGSGTALTDRPTLTCRLPGCAHLSPVRVIAGRRAAEAALAQAAPGSRPEVSMAVPTWYAVPQSRAERLASLAGGGAVPLELEQFAVQDVGGRLWLPDLMEQLVARGMTRLLVEGGPSLWRAFAEARLVDEIVLFHARADAAIPVSADAAYRALATYMPDAGLTIVTRRPVGSDDMFVFRGPEAAGWHGTRGRAENEGDGDVHGLD
ncbi:MAG: bifunctional diaminohydroxyphosphoribosylaminopyrimidine deaminase/5-amino-6-(5-phosphoribosylamino)uracil reductase RibD [Pseudomonadota bacterium]